MVAARIIRIQTIRVFKMRVGAADGLGLFVHYRDKTAHVSGDVLGENICRVVGGIHQHTVHQIAYRALLSHLKANAGGFQIDGGQLPWVIRLER